MDRLEIVVPGSNGEAVFSRFMENLFRGVKMDKMVTRGRRSIHLQKASQLSNEWGGGQAVRILVIEDEKKIAEFIRRGLKEEAYSVDVAYDGEQGYSLVKTNEYDLIILDLMLPKIDGIALCRKLREEGVTVPILILTARDLVEDKVLGLDSGANDYLTKPFAFEELLARCRALLRRYESPTPTGLKVADLALDLLSHRVTRAGQEISLTNRAYALLEYLMRNAGNLVTRTMIAEHVWDINFASFTNIIDVYINRLRNKIDRGFSQPLIHTIRGRGYMLKE